MRVLVIGATGMLGSAVCRVVGAQDGFEVWGTVRGSRPQQEFLSGVKIVTNVDVLNQDVVTHAITMVRPNVIVNCAGLVKQLPESQLPLTALPVNALFPHRLCAIANLASARVIHISTDCVFSGKRGMYSEADVPDAEDVYGQSKALGELHDAAHALTLRTSVIGHEHGTNRSLIDWFLSQPGPVKGYSKAIFSGVPAVELARIIRDIVIPNEALCGLYHVSANPIDKLSLLRIVSEVYGKPMTFIEDTEVQIDRSLDSTRFRQSTGYQPNEWDALIRLMHRLR